MDECPSVVGARAEREVAYALERTGWHVYLPMFASHARVDLVALRGADCLRIQVKTSLLKKGVVVFRPYSNTGNVPRNYHQGEVDVFGVYSPELDRVFVVPIEDTSTRWCSLRLGPTANNQAAGVRFAKDYELTPPR
jgi:hypothetical protein